MRNTFDQYDQYENRLTHALLIALFHDRVLLRKFLKQYAGGLPLDSQSIDITEQNLPGVPDKTIPISLGKSLPDGIIFDGEGRALIIESKITSPLTTDQLQRHTGIVRRQGFSEVAGLALVTDGGSNFPTGWEVVQWSDLYRWLTAQTGSSVWLRELIGYFQVLEAQMVRENSLGDRMLTRFDGIPFSSAHPYSYVEAKRVIKLLRSKVHSEKELLDKLKVDSAAPGRSAITDQVVLWDYFSLKAHLKGKPFTAYPHMTFGVGATAASAMVTVPDAVQRSILATLRKASAIEFTEAVQQFLSGVSGQLGHTTGVRPSMRILQRRYPSQKSQAILDADLDIDLRTAVANRHAKRDRPKFQPEWLDMARAVIKHKASNMQFQIGCQFEYARCPSIREPDAHLLFLRSWKAAKAFFECLGIDL